MPKVTILWLCVLLGGCGHTGVGTLAVGAACPPAKDYTGRQQSAVRDELRSCGAGCKSVRGWLADYHVLRAQVRACRSASFALRRSSGRP